MSQLSDFDTAAFTISKAVIGVAAFIIGTGGSVDVIDGEGSHDRTSEEAGYEDANTRTVVASRLDFEDKYEGNVRNYEGKLCTVDGVTWRIGSILDDVNYITFMLVGGEEVA